MRRSMARRGRLLGKHRGASEVRARTCASRRSAGRRSQDWPPRNRCIEISDPTDTCRFRECAAGNRPGTRGERRARQDDVVQDALKELVGLGGLLPESASFEVAPERFDDLTRIVRSLVAPPTAEEARAAAGLFPPDETSCFGLAWTLVHFIEKAPGWPYPEVLDDRNWWVQFLRERAERGGLLPH
jgi:hypothetical protein